MKVLAAALLLGPVVAIEAYCEVYMSEEKAAAAIFPGLSFTKSQVIPTSPQLDKIMKVSGQLITRAPLTIFKTASGEWVLIDRVVGKHEYITYAVGIKDGKIKGIEILEYREAYGGQVRGEAWRSQFVGKDLTAPLQVDSDIKNISGATMSSTHLTAGVRRALVIYDVLVN